MNIQKIFKNRLFSFNHGGGIDLGVSYKLQLNLQLSAILTDLGFIHWKKGIKIGFQQEKTDGVTLQNKVNKFLKSNSLSQETYTSYLMPQLCLGEEFDIWDQKIGFGLFIAKSFTDKNLLECTDWMTSINFRPYPWLNSTISYTLSNGSFSDATGFGIQLNVGPLIIYGSIDSFFYWKSNSQILYFRKSGKNQCSNQLLFGIQRTCQQDQQKKDLCLDNDIPDYSDQYSDPFIESNKEKIPNDSNKYLVCHL